MQIDDESGKESVLGEGVLVVVGGEVFVRLGE